MACQVLVLVRTGAAHAFVGAAPRAGVLRRSEVGGGPERQRTGVTQVRDGGEGLRHEVVEQSEDWMSRVARRLGDGRSTPGGVLGRRPAIRNGHGEGHREELGR